MRAGGEAENKRNSAALKSSREKGLVVPQDRVCAAGPLSTENEGARIVRGNRGGGLGAEDRGGGRVHVDRVGEEGRFRGRRWLRALMPFYSRPRGDVEFPLVDIATGWGAALAQRGEFPTAPGVYALVRPAAPTGALPTVVYVGMSEQSLAKRWSDHLELRHALLIGTRSATGHHEQDHVLQATHLNEFRRRAMRVWWWVSARPADDEALFVRAHMLAHGHRPLHNNAEPRGNEDFVIEHLAGASYWIRGHTEGLM